MKRHVWAMTFAASIFVLSACSGSSSDTEPTTTLATPVTTSPVTTSPVTTSPVTTSPASSPTTTSSIPVPMPLVTVTSTAYAEGDRIPVIHTCDGEDISPDYSFADLPAETVSMVLTMDDPDAPGGVWDHWVEFDIPPGSEIPEGATEFGTMGSNSWGTLGYRGPCPPPGNAHRYIVTVYALDGVLDLDEGATKGAVLAAMEGHVIAAGELLGEFSR